MNIKQKTVIILGVLIGVAMIIYPPINIEEINPLRYMMGTDMPIPSSFMPGVEPTVTIIRYRLINGGELRYINWKWLGIQWLIVAIISSILILSLSDRVAKFENEMFLCPCCKEQINWKQRTRFWNIFRLKSAPCPHCGIQLKWSKLPFSLMAVGGCISLVYIIPLFLKAVVIAIVILAIGMAVVVVGLCRLKFEKYDSDKNNDSK